MKRTKTVQVYLTNDEHQQLLQAKDTPRLGIWLREIALAEATKKPRQPRHRNHEIPKDLLLNVARLGGNLNQIAKKLNTNDDILTQAEALVYLADLRDFVHDLRAKYDI